jgi:undecaprenyl-phosphate galactose phosphotransferase/putative colanic acid biosynthesis UDP-glucose lipid carrier transferase
MLLLNSAYLLSFFFRFFNFYRLSLEENINVLIIANIVWPILAQNFKMYVFIRLEPIEKTLAKMVKMVLLFAIIIFAFLEILDYVDISRLRVFYFILIFFIEIFICRILFIQLLKRLRTAGFNYRNVVIIGSNFRAIAMESVLSKDVAHGYRVLGFFSDNENTAKSKLLGKLDEALTFVINNQVHEVYLSVSNINAEYVQELIRYCESNLIKVSFIPDFSNFTRSRKVHIDFYENIPVVSLRTEPLEGTFNTIIKRTFDIVFSILIIVLIFPWLFPLLILLVKISSRGTVFFKQERSGKNNQTFWCYKFRTMRINSFANELQATPNDMRITLIGKYLRKTNLDELPQFFNVLMGDMSVVGPRPHMLKHTKEYSELINTYLVRHLIRPGITGWAQVNGYRGETSNILQMQNRVEYDIWYIENWSFLLDIKIIFKTVINVVKGEKNAM